MEHQVQLVQQDILQVVEVVLVLQVQVLEEQEVLVVVEKVVLFVVMLQELQEQ